MRPKVQEVIVLEAAKASLFPKMLEAVWDYPETPQRGAAAVAEAPEGAEEFSQNKVKSYRLPEQ